jgi:hypothetical protein
MRAMSGESRALAAERSVAAAVVRLTRFNSLLQNVKNTRPGPSGSDVRKYAL